MSAQSEQAEQAGTRERLLDAAARLAYRDGVNVGVEALCRSAGAGLTLEP